MCFYICQDCIPQYFLGHFRRVGEYTSRHLKILGCGKMLFASVFAFPESMRSFIRKNNLSLSLIGSSYDGVSVNDVIFSGRTAAEELLGI